MLLNVKVVPPDRVTYSVPGRKNRDFQYTYSMQPFPCSRPLSVGQCNYFDFDHIDSPNYEGRTGKGDQIYGKRLGAL